VVREPDHVGECSFCSRMAGEHSANTAEPWQTVIFESPNFVVWPSMGGFVEGWLLAVPKEHALNVSQMSVGGRAELGRLLDHVTADLRRVYGPIVAFEHGPVHAAQPVGCGIDHAHVHLVPYQASFHREVEATLGRQLTWEPLASLADVPSGRALPYVSVQDSDGRSFVCFDAAIPSQLGRRTLGRLEQTQTWDWRSDPHVQTVSRTVRRLSGAPQAVAASGAV
jgi:ATP adenylyltransferase